MKKNIGVIAAAFLAAAALTACGGSKPAETTAAETKSEAAETTAAESGAEAESSEAEAKTDDLKELTVGEARLLTQRFWRLQGKSLQRRVTILRSLSIPTMYSRTWHWMQAIWMQTTSSIFRIWSSSMRREGPS